MSSSPVKLSFMICLISYGIVVLKRKGILSYASRCGSSTEICNPATFPKKRFKLLDLCYYLAVLPEDRCAGLREAHQGRRVAVSCGASCHALLVTTFFTDRSQ